MNPQPPPKRTCIVRMTGALREQLQQHVFRRYPDKEWATFFRFGFRATESELVITLADMFGPEDGDLDETVAHVDFREPYSLRAALDVARGPLLMGVVHSHPEDYHPVASELDDNMDSYYAEYFGSFAGERACYASLIFARAASGSVSIAGRASFDGEWLSIDDFLVVDDVEIRRERAFGRPEETPANPFTERLQSIYGRAAAHRLSRARIGIIGCSGTGSPAAHVLARAGVGGLVLVDPQRVESSNRERIHGLNMSHLREEPPPYKVQVVGEMVGEIAPELDVIAIAGSVLDPVVRDELVRCDLVLGCTDKVHPRVALAELAYRYLVPALDVGVLPEGADGTVAAEWTQIVAYWPGGPCAYCLDEIDGWRLKVELMSDTERESRRAAAAAARERGDAEGGYWRDEPQLHTVGHLTTMAGALAAGYAIGWLTGRFRVPAPFLQFDIVASDFGFRGFARDGRSECACTSIIGHADQGASRAAITPPDHLEPAKRIALTSSPEAPVGVKR